MRKEDLKDGMIIEVEFTAIPNIRFIKLGYRGVTINDFIGLTAMADNLCWENCRIIKVFKNKAMTCLEDINDDNCLELIWEREREIDWNKIPKWTKVQAWDENEKYTIDSLLVAYEPELRFGLIVADNKDDEPRGYKHCKIHPSVEIKEEWYK